MTAQSTLTESAHGAPPRLQLAGISKSYPGVVANSDIALGVLPGQIHAVLGENGAGKSTLMKIIYGSVKPDAGSMAIDGQPVVVRNPQEARALGISMVFQHFSLFDTLTVAENVWLGLGKQLNLAQVSQRIVQTAQAYGLPLDPLRPVHTLSVGERQRVEIVRALMTNPKLLILDEPTSVLTPQAVETLFVTLRQLAAEGCSILYISHKLHEIRALCTACTVLRVGKLGPAQRRRLGLHFVPEERLGRGAVPALSLARNLLLTRKDAVGAGGWLKRGALQAQAEQIIARYKVKCGGPQAAAKSLSGGNLQKFIMGREIDAGPALLIVSQPTWGVDVGASSQIRGELLKLADAGCAVLVVSEELDELFEICDRLYVIAKGQLSPSLPRAEATVEKVGLWMSGLWSSATSAAAAAKAHHAQA